MEEGGSLGEIRDVIEGEKAEESSV
ncbi:hypothetical protein CCACVL1_25336 [Corchorus capsularis]|uniref:Uncharacterized protein n=1 Tax=Corchorus capsularis TaxID=210143 RepID=A0A1R3GL49_COCAP|nr:hypothetical protein CCACVL1_25336 [Corchorus capsularis]